MTDELVLRRGVGKPVKCRSCKKPIVFAHHHNGGKVAPFEEDAAGEWTLENGVAKHIGKPSSQLELGAVPVTRYTSHFAVCPDARKWRK